MTGQYLEHSAELVNTNRELRRKLLELYFEKGIAGVRDHLNVVCPGCVTDLVTGYVISDSQRVIESEFGSD